MISPSIVFLLFSIVAEFFFKVKFNKILLVIGINKIKPIKSEKKPGIINNTAARAIDAPDTIHKLEFYFDKNSYAFP